MARNAIWFVTMGTLLSFLNLWHGTSSKEFRDKDPPLIPLLKAAEVSKVPRSQTMEPTPSPTEVARKSQTSGPRPSPTTPLTLKEQRQVVPQRVLLATWVFGEEAANLRRFQMFTQTAATAGFDFVVLGDPAPSFALPSNVRHYQVTWDQLVDRLLDKVFANKSTVVDSARVQELRNAPKYKVCDFKPLIGHLFPELFQGYSWWGHIDNDLLLGNLTNFFPQEMLRRYDILTASSLFVWGPYTMYRNTPKVNSLFLKVSKHLPLDNLFLSKNYSFFDEWGFYGAINHQILQTNKSYKEASMQKSMYGVVKAYSGRLGLKLDRKGGGQRWGLWDKGKCKRDVGSINSKGEFPPLPDRCAECTYTKNPGSNGQVLTEFKTGKERFLCHYEWSKSVMEKALKNTTKFEELLQAGMFRVNGNDGFDYVMEA